MENKDIIYSVTNTKLRKLYNNHVPLYVLSRYNEEIEIIKKQNQIDIYTIVYLLCKRFRKDKIIFFQKGTIGSMLVSYLLDISYINPIEYNTPYIINTGLMKELYFEIALPEKYLNEYKQYLAYILNKMNLNQLIPFIKLVPFVDISGRMNIKISTIKKEFPSNRNIDLISILGLVLGTDIWEDNIKDIIDTYSIADMPITRDDVYIKLTNNGIDKILAYKIMNFVSTGKQTNEKHLTEWNAYIKTIREHHIEEWYINVLKKVTYMFPKAHCCNLAMIYNIYNKDV